LSLPPVGPAGLDRRHPARVVRASPLSMSYISVDTRHTPDVPADYSQPLSLAIGTASARLPKHSSRCRPTSGNRQSNDFTGQ
jgi:hypothetical protein